MPELFWSHGHIALPLFCALVFTAVLGLIMDYSWRVVRMRSSYLAVGGVALWLCGILAIVLSANSVQ